MQDTEPTTTNGVQAHPVHLAKSNIGLTLTQNFTVVLLPHLVASGQLIQLTCHILISACDGLFPGAISGEE
jgi:hypothetical protein